MFAFILGFMFGGAAGAVLVLALSPKYQYLNNQDIEGNGSVRENENELQSRISEALAQGKKAAEEKSKELEQVIRSRRNPGEKA